MQKIFLPILILIISLSSCSQSIENTQTFQESTPSNAVNESINQVGYYAHNGYLWQDKEKLGEIDPRFTIWNQFEQDGKEYLFLMSYGDCAGCNLFSNDYFVVDKENNLLTSKSYEPTQFFTRMIPDTTITSPDHTKAAFIKYEEGKEEVWIFDFLTGEEKKISDISSDESLLDCILVCRIEEDSFYWPSNSNLPIINPTIKPEIEKDRLINEYGLIRIYPDSEKFQGSSQVEIYGYEREFGNQNSGGYLIYDPVSSMIIENKLEARKFVSYYFVKRLSFQPSTEVVFLYYNDDYNALPLQQGDNVKVFTSSYQDEWQIAFEEYQGLICGSCDDARRISKNDAFRYTFNNEIEYTPVDGILITIENQHLGKHTSYEYVHLKWKEGIMTENHYTDQNLPSDLVELVNAT